MKLPAGGWFRSPSSAPQQAIVASVRSAHAWAPAMLTAVKLPAGADHRPQSMPQQMILASALIAHEWPLPVLTDLKLPAGGLACLKSSCVTSSPQHASVLSVRTPQA